VGEVTEPTQPTRPTQPNRPTQPTRPTQPNRPTRPTGPPPDRSDGLNELLRDVLLGERELRAAFARRLGLNLTELSAMEHLILEQMGPVELSRRLDVTSAAATVMLHRLEESGHVQRRPHASDRRRQVVEPTSEGLAAVYGQLRPMLEGLDEIARSLSADERAVVAGYLTRAAEVLRRSAEPINHRN
jgi:DNA-binding MarR family transcriptional regulator